MAILIIEHNDLDSSQRLGETLRDHGYKLVVVQAHCGQSLPVDLDDIDGVVSLGGPQNTDEVDEHPWMAREIEIIKEAHDRKLSVVGVCLGAQLIAVALGGEVARMDKPEMGMANCEQSFFGTTDPMLTGIPWNVMQMHAHGCEVTAAPPGGTPMPLASSEGCKIQAFRVGLTTYGFQYHFEWTRKRCMDVVDNNPQWVEAMQTTPDAIKQGIDEHYDFYRHLGDRQCKLIADRLFPLDKRLPPTGVEVANFRNH